MNIQTTKYVRTNFVPSGPISYNQSVAKKYFKYIKKQEKKKSPTAATSKIESQFSTLEHEVGRGSPEKSYKRQEIEKWLKSLDLAERLKVFSIQNKWLCQIIQQMYYYYRMNSNNRFLLRPEDIGNEEIYMQYYNYEHQYPYIVNENNYQFDIYFKYAPLPENLNVSEERSFLEKIRFFDLKESNDSFTLSVSLLNNLDELFYFFDFFSKKRAFLNACTVSYENVIKLYFCNYPTWFNSKAYNSIPEIIVAHLEQVICIKFWVHQIQSKLTTPDKVLNSNFSIIEEQRFNEMIESRINIIKFLKKEYHNRKDALFEKLEIKSLIDEVKTDSSIIARVKSRRPDVKPHCYRLNSFKCDLLDPFIYNNEFDFFKLLDEVKKVLYNKNEENFVDELVFCGLERSQTYEEFLYKKVFEKLHHFHSEKNAIELLNGEYEKKESKKKKSKRKSQKSNENKIVEENKKVDSLNFEVESKYKSFLKSVYINSVQNSKLIINDMCRSIVLSLVSKIVTNEKFVANYSKKKRKTDELLNEIIKKEKLADLQENLENISINDETAYSSTNISDNKSTQYHLLKATSPSSDKNRRVIIKERKIHAKRSNSNEEILSSNNDKKNQETPCKENREYKEELKLEDNHQLEKEEGLEEILNNQKKKKNKHKKFKIRKQSTNLPKFPQNSLGNLKKTMSENNKSNNNSDRKKSENLNKQILASVLLDNNNNLNVPKENYANKVNVENQNIHSNTSHFNKEQLNEKICQNIQYFSINNKIPNAPPQNMKPKYNKYNSLSNQNHIPHQKSINPVQNLIINEEMSYPNTFKNIFPQPIQKNPDFLTPPPKFFPFLSPPVFPNPIDFEQKFFMSMMNPFINKQIDNFNIINKFEEKYFPNNFEIILHNDIIDYSNSINKMNLMMRDFKFFTINYIENLIRQCLGNKEFCIDVHGSFATDLSIECSDIDLTVRLNEQYSNIESIINLVYNKFDKMRLFDSLIPIYTASVPILKIQINPLSILDDPLRERFIEFKNSEFYSEYKFEKEELNKIKIDITFTDKSSKTHCTFSAVDWAKKQIFIYPEVKPLVHVIKRHLQLNKLNSSFNGGLSSYSLLLMIVAYIKYSKTILMRSLLDLGTLLQDFYEFFGRFFDFSCGVIDVNQINPISIANDKLDTYPTIHDPLNYTNVAKNSYRIKEVKEVFLNALDIIQKEKQDWNKHVREIVQKQDSLNMVYEMFFFFKKSIILSSN